MAKLISYDYLNNVIIANWETSSDYISFTDIYNKFKTTPIVPLSFPKLYGNVSVIIGDVNTFVGIPNDKIQVVVNSVVYDNIDVSDIIDIAWLVTRINTVVWIIYWYNIASVSTGYLKLSVVWANGTWDVTIADGTLTGTTCIARIFNIATRTKSITNNPYELTEWNAADRTWLNGMGNWVLDTTNFASGTSSIKSTKSWNQTSKAITRINGGYTTAYTRIFMTNTSLLAVWDEIEVSGTVNYPWKIYRIESIATNSSITCLTPYWYPTIDETRAATIIKKNTISWNNGYTLPQISSWVATHVSFYVKSDWVSTPKLDNIIIRYAQSASPSATGFWLWITKNVNITMTATFTRYDIPITDFYLFMANTNAFNTDRISKIYLSFSWLNIGETVWIDWFAFTNPLPNPTNSIGTYTFKTPLKCIWYFSDYAFNVIFDIIASGANNSGSRLDMQAANVGDMLLWDTTNTWYNCSSTILFNYYAYVDLWYLTLSKVTTNYIQFDTPKLKSWPRPNSTNTLNTFNNTIFSGIGWFLSTSENLSTFNNCVFSTVDTLLNQSASRSAIFNWCTIISKNTSRAIYNTKNTSVITYKWLIFTSSTVLAYQNSNAGTWTISSVRLINLDASWCSNPTVLCNGNTTIPANIYISISIILKILDSNGTPIEWGTVTIKDNAGNTLLTTTTDIDGTFSEWYIDVINNRVATATLVTRYLNTPLVWWTRYYPFTLTVEKAWYETYSEIILPVYSKSDNIVKKWLNKEITLKTAKPIRLDVDWNVYKALSPELWSSAKTIQL